MKRIQLQIRRFLLSAVSATVAFTASAQTAEDSVKATVNSLFAAMRNADAAALKHCFTDSALLQTITRAGAVRSETVVGFAKQIASLPQDSADERIRFDAVKIDGDLASVWTPYQFYYAGRFSHCGVNSFQLVRTAGVWRIQYLIDTRRRQGCQTD